MMYAVIRVRGSVNVEHDAKKTMKLLKLTRPNHCVVYPEEKSIEGMFNAVDSYVTWGKIDQETLEKLVYKRGRMPGNKKVEKKYAKGIAKNIGDKKESKIKDVFRLSPPSGGYKSVKKFFPKGAVGSRGDKINELLKRML